MNRIKFLVAIVAICTLMFMYSCEKEFTLGPKITVIKPKFDDSVKVNKKVLITSEFYDADGLQSISLQAFVKVGKTDSLIFTSQSSAQGVETYKLDTSLLFTNPVGWVTLLFEAKDFDGTPSQQISRVRIYQ